MARKNLQFHEDIPIRIEAQREPIEFSAISIAGENIPVNKTRVTRKYTYPQTLVLDGSFPMAPEQSQC